jgi:hypothetical protein
MVCGGGLDYYCIGRLDNQDDRAALKQVKDVFQFHKKHERYFTDIKSDAKICLLRGSGTSRAGFSGFIRMLSENHILFDCMQAWKLDYTDSPKKLENYDLLILPDIQQMSDKACERIDTYVENGGLILATGYISTKDDLGNPTNMFRLKSMGVKPKFMVQEKARATYLKFTTKDKEYFSNVSFNDLDIVYVYSDFIKCIPEEMAKGFLKFIPPSMHGPPEKCYYTEITDFPGLVVYTYGKGKFVYFPWQIGKQYNNKAHHGFAMLVMAAIQDLLHFEQDIKVKTSPLIEVTHQESKSGNFEWIGFANHSGQIGTAFYKPVPIMDTFIEFQSTKNIKTLKLLKQNKKLEYSNERNCYSVNVPMIGDYEILVVEYE